MQGEIGPLGFFGETAEKLRELFLGGVGGGEGFGCEERFFVEEEGSGWDGLRCENALPFPRDGLDFPHWGG